MMLLAVGESGGANVQDGDNGSVSVRVIVMVAALVFRWQKIMVAVVFT
jgi:hypothetical protein